MKLFHFHHIGQRKTQEDDLYIDPVGRLFIVCDGVGGREYGEKASALVIEKLVDKFKNSHSPLSTEELNQMIRSLDQDFSEYLSANVQQDGMASTLVLLYLTEDQAIVSHIGDSRLYHIRSREDWWVTKDHSMVMELHEAGIIKSEKDMNEHPLRNRITNAVKITKQFQLLEPDTTKRDSVQKGDLFFLCTDGVMESFASQELVDLLTTKTLPLEKRWQMLENNCAKFAKDNHTAILIEL